MFFRVSKQSFLCVLGLSVTGATTFTKSVSCKRISTGSVGLACPVVSVIEFCGVPSPKGVGLVGTNFASRHSSLRIQLQWLRCIQHCLGSAVSNNDLGMAWVYSAEIVEYLHYIFDESEGPLYFFPCTC